MDAVAQREMNPASFTLSRSSSISIIRKRHAHWQLESLEYNKKAYLFNLKGGKQMKKILTSLFTFFFLFSVSPHIVQAVSCGDTDNNPGTPLVPCYLTGAFDLSNIPLEFRPGQANAAFENPINPSNGDPSSLTWVSSADLTSSLVYTPSDLAASFTPSELVFAEMKFTNGTNPSSMPGDDVWDIDLNFGSLTLVGLTSGSPYVLTTSTHMNIVTETLNVNPDPEDNNDFLEIISGGNALNLCPPEAENCVGTPEMHRTTFNVMGDITGAGGMPVIENLMITNFNEPVPSASSAFLLPLTSSPIPLSIGNLRVTNVVTEPVPEPSTILLLGFGSVVLLLWRRAKLRKEPN